MRSDAQRNRERILAAARDRVAAVGPEVSMEEIAGSAGVAVGTLYRHFPAKHDLIAAVVDDSIEQIAGLAEASRVAVERGEAAGPVLADLFRAIARRWVNDRAFKAAAGRLEPTIELPEAPAGTPTARANAAITALLEQAQRDHQVRADVTLTDLVMLIAALPGPEVPEQQRERYVEIVLAGLR